MRAAPLSEVKNTKVFSLIPSCWRCFRILPTLSSISLTASPYLRQKEMQNTQSSKKKRVSTMCSVDLICTCAAEILLMHQVFCWHCKLLYLWPAENSPSGVLRGRLCSGGSHSWTEKFSHKTHKERQTHLATDWEVIALLSSWLETL